jgi:uncharacterized protein (DUF302 family)
MGYTFTRTLDRPFDETIDHVTKALADAGFGVLSDIDVAGTMKKKLDRDMAPYRILGACNPKMAWEALEAEPRIGAMLPCNVIVRSIDDGRTEVSAVDPVASMQAIDNADLGKVAQDVRTMLREVVDGL